MTKIIRDFSKKALAVFLSVLMLMTAWVFSAPEKASAANHSLSASVSISGDDSIDQVNTTVSWGNNKGHTSGSGSVGGRSGGTINGCTGPPTGFTISGRQIERANASTQRKATVTVRIYWDGTQVGYGQYTWDSGVDGNYTQDTYRYPSNSGSCSSTVPESGWQTNGTQHWKVCNVCGVITTSKANHTGGTATCTAAKTCSTCGVSYGSALGHDFSGAYHTVSSGTPTRR